MGMGDIQEPPTWSTSKVKSGQRVLDQMKWVIFPDNKWIKRWDMLILALLFFVAFVIPYQVCVSLGRRLWQSVWWTVVNIFINAIFFADTFLYFWRAYRTADGHVVVNLRKIGLRYLRTYFIPNLISSSPSIITSHKLYREEGIDVMEGIFRRDERRDSLHLLIWLASTLKLVRLARVKTIVRSSDAIMDFRDKHHTQALELVKYTFLIIVASHLLACIWCLVAFIEARGSFQDGLLESRNWIAHWYNSTYEEGGLQPLGMNNDIDRYVLSLFWAIQTITSIGYGNIAPFTPLEWFVACVLMLAAAVMWACAIGGLVAVMAAMFARNEIYRARLDDARSMITQFEQDVSVGTGEDCEKVAKRIRRFIHNQKSVSRNSVCVSSMGQSFPVFNTLSPQLQLKASACILRKCIEMVPYLSSRFLSINEQSEVSVQCLFLDVPADEKIDIKCGVRHFGRGIFVIQRGVAIASFAGKRKLSLLVVGTVFGDDTVLVEDGRPASQGFLRFLTFSKVVFIPRRAVVVALRENKEAWKKCARWKYLQALLRLENVN